MRYSFSICLSALILLGCDPSQSEAIVQTPRVESLPAVDAPEQDPPPPIGALGTAGDPTAWSPASDFGKPINRDFAGITCFRGNAQRNYYGDGAIPAGNLRVLWRLPIGSVDGYWTGIGWTGQPLAIEWPEQTRKWMNFTEQPGPRTEIIVGALDGQVHFVDADTGRRSRKPLKMPAPYPVKGTVTVDPRGYPLLLVGPGMNRGQTGYRIFSLIDFKELYNIRGIDSSAPRGWPAFDANGIVLRDTLLQVGENGMYYQVTLNSSWDSDTGNLKIDPEVHKIRVTAAGIESSVSVWGDYAYFGDNVGGLWRIALDSPSEAQKVATLGDDSDSTITFDNNGAFYVGIQVDKLAGRGGKGKLFKFDAMGMKPLWTYSFTAGSIAKVEGRNAINGGVLSTVALSVEHDLVYLTTTHHPRIGGGYLIALERETGKTRWQMKMRGYGWSSPLVLGDRVLAIDSGGNVFVRDASTGDSLLTNSAGVKIESIALGSTVEASPIVWREKIYIGVRGGALICLGN